MTNQPFFPKGPIRKVEGRCIVLRGDDIDTDRIIPARFLKCINFDSLGEEVFTDDRNELSGKHPFDLASNRGASILVVNENFGCGSSREHAPQALMRWGIRALIGQSFAEIFYGNCLALGIPCATAEPNQINELQKTIEKDNSELWELDIKAQRISSSSRKIDLRIDEGSAEMFKTGRWDATSTLIAQDLLINETIKKLPYLNNFER